MRPATGRKWGSVSFASTLHLCPILDLLLADVPNRLKNDVRLGLQEALVNAVKHGNQLDPGKTISVQFFFFSDQYWWVISDQGQGFSPNGCSCDAHDLPEHSEENIPLSECQENGRGLYILHQIFDQVKWNAEGTELRLCKQVRHLAKLPLLSF